MIDLSSTGIFAVLSLIEKFAVLGSINVPKMYPRGIGAGCEEPVFLNPSDSIVSN